MPKLISDWWKSKFICATCGTDKSVKYEVDGEPHCSSCALRDIKRR